MAEIYKARLEGIGGFQRIFAIKRILPHLSQNGEYVAMLVDEAKVAGLLSHANIVQILDLGQVSGVWYIAMEYVEGRDLGRVLRRASEKGLSLPLPHTVFVTIELLKGLEYAHQRQVMRGGRPVPLNIIHRDISPPNILLSFQGEVKLTDFGIARASHKALETQTGVVKGRFDYMSPEQSEAAKDLDQRSDLFSVGVVLYEMLTGTHPFRAESELATLERIRAGTYEPVSTVNPGVPFTLETIVDRALRVDRDERYPSATAFKEALDKFFHDSGFIFTHSTLASYVKGLFPKASQTGGPTPSTPPPRLHLSDTQPGARPRSVDNDRDSTREVGRDLLDPPTEEVPITPPRGLGQPPADDPTLVRENPLTKAMVDAQWEDDQPTVIKPNPFTPVPLTPVPLAPSSMPASEQDTLVRPALFIDEIEASLPPYRPHETTPNKRPGLAASGDIDVDVTPTRSTSLFARPALGWLGALLAFIGLLVGLSLGTILGAVGLHLSGLSAPTPAPVSAPVLAPIPPGPSVLRVLAPPGIEVRVDGTLLAQEQLSVSPHEEHVVVLSAAGYSPREMTLSLEPGEERVLLITQQAMEKNEE